MQEQQVRQIVGEALRAVAPEVHIEQLDPAISFRDQIDIDSVDFLNFALALERGIGRRIAEIDYPKLSSLNGCLAYFAHHTVG
jgi:acyl carrier protein